jgi:serine/threonine-protein kinase
MLLYAASRPAPRLATVAPHVPGPITNVVDRALAFQKEDRFPDARAMQIALEDAYREAFRAQVPGAKTIIRVHADRASKPGGPSKVDVGSPRDSRAAGVLAATVDATVEQVGMELLGGIDRIDPTGLTEPGAFTPIGAVRGATVPAPPLALPLMKTPSTTGGMFTNLVGALPSDVPRRNAGRIGALAIACVIVGGILAAGVTTIVGRGTTMAPVVGEATSAPPSVTGAAPVPLTSLRTTATNVVVESVPSVPASALPSVPPARSAASSTAHVAAAATSPPRVATPSAAAAAPVAKPDCDPPYVWKDGLKEWKRECLHQR